MTPRVLLVDNYDSFTYNLAQAFLMLDGEVVVRRNDALTVDDLGEIAPTHLCISPGPGRPEDAGASVALIRAAAGHIPTLGVCLGHQAIVVAFGGEVVRASKPMHGKSSILLHDEQGCFAGVDQRCVVGRYHSLVALEARLPPDLVVSARTAAGDVMAVRHRRLSIEGVQFHPESILTPAGGSMLRNFVSTTSGVSVPL